jgi:hypothetical protein
MMRSTWGGLLIFTQAVIQLSPLANEPGHPQEVIALLLASALLAAAWMPPRSGIFEVLGLIAAALFCTKINVGIFFGMALLALLAFSTPRLARAPWAGYLIWGCGLLPFFLMRSHLAAGWCRSCGFIACCVIVSTLLVAQRTGSFLAEGQGARWQNWTRAGVLFCALGALILGIALLTGTSWRGLLDGMLLTPLKMAGVAVLPLPVRNIALFNAAAALGLGFVAARRPLEAGLYRCLNLLKLAYGIAGCLSLASDAQAQWIYLLPWVWLILVRPDGLVPEKAEPGTRVQAPSAFPRMFLCLAAACQSLQIYPIAGTQVTLATLFLTPVCVLCLWDFWNQPVIASAWLAKLSPSGLRWLRVLGAATLLCLFASVRCHLPQVRAEYGRLLPLDLPGSRRVRFDAETTEMYRALSAYLRTECDTFVTYPGIHSLYFWTGKRSPTHLNSTGWGQLTHIQQQHILASLRKVQRPMLVVVAAQARGWSSQPPPQIAPLIHCVLEECHEAARIGRFIIYIPDSQSHVEKEPAVKTS